MSTAVSILQSRFNGLGINTATVQQQGSQLIDISIPGKSASQIQPLLSAAQLRFRQVLLCTTLVPSNAICQPGAKPAGSGLPSVATAIPTPTPTPTSTPSSTPKASSSPKSTSSPTSGGKGQAFGAKPLAPPSPKPTSSPSRPSSASPQSSPSRSPD